MLCAKIHNRKVDMNKFGTALLLVLLTCFTLTVLGYYFFIINILSHKSAVVILVFSILNLMVDYAVWFSGFKFKNTLGTKIISDLSILCLIYTLMQFITVFLTRNSLSTFLYTLVQLSILFIFVISILFRILSKSK